MRSEEDPSLFLNRLSKWSVASEKEITVGIGASGEEQPILHAKYAVRVELDYNTAARNTGLNNAWALANELLREVQSTLADGEPRAESPPKKTP